MAQTIATEPRRPGRQPVIKTAPQELGAADSDNSSPAPISASPPNLMVEASVPNLIPSEAAPSESPPRRRQRVNPFGTHEQKLSYAPRPGYHRHWFNDVPNRIVQALEGGYTHVVGKDGKNVARRVGVAQDGSALNAYLMEIRQEWYDEDMSAQHAEVDKTEEAMRRGIVPGGNAERQYLPLRPDGTPQIQIVHGAR